MARAGPQRAPAPVPSGGRSKNRRQEGLTRAVFRGIIELDMVDSRLVHWDWHSRWKPPRSSVKNALVVILLLVSIVFLAMLCFFIYTIMVLSGIIPGIGAD